MSSSVSALSSLSARTLVFLVALGFAAAFGAAFAAAFLAGALVAFFFVGTNPSDSDPETSRSKFSSESLMVLQVVRIRENIVQRGAQGWFRMLWLAEVGEEGAGVVMVRVRSLNASRDHLSSRPARDISAYTIAPCPAVEL